jgi:hypothetical protein
LQGNTGGMFWYIQHTQCITISHLPNTCLMHEPSNCKDDFYLYDQCVFTEDDCILRCCTRQSISMRLEGATSQKTVNFTLTTVRTWNLTMCIHCWTLLYANHQNLYRWIQIVWFQTNQQHIILTGYFNNKESVSNKNWYGIGLYRKGGKNIFWMCMLKCCRALCSLK